MANESTSSTLSELYTEIVAEALFVASERSIMRPLVRNYAVTGGGKSVEVPIYSAVSAAAVSEASDLSNTAIDPTSKTITCFLKKRNRCFRENHSKIPSRTAARARSGDFSRPHSRRSAIFQQNRSQK